MMRDELHEFFFQIFYRTEHTAPDCLVGDQTEETLNNDRANQNEADRESMVGASS